MSPRQAKSIKPGDVIGWWASEELRKEGHDSQVQVQVKHCTLQTLHHTADGIPGIVICSSGGWCQFYSLNEIHLVKRGKPEDDTFATVSWNWREIKSMNPRWSKDKCEEFLQEHEKYLTEAMIDRGWNYISSYL